MDHPPEDPLELDLRRLRRLFVVYRREGYPRFGEGRTAQLGYRDFVRRAHQYMTIQRLLAEGYARHPALATAPAAERARLVDLELQASNLEAELCWS